LRVHEYNKNNENDKTSICICMYVGTLYIQKYTHVSMPLSRSRGPVCLPIFVAIVVLQALSPTHVHMHVNNAALTLRHTHIHTGPHTFAGVFIVVAEKHG